MRQVPALMIPAWIGYDGAVIRLQEVSMGPVLRSALLLVAALLIGCAGTAQRDAGGGLLTRPGEVAEGAGVGHAGPGSPASGPESQTVSGRAPAVEAAPGRSSATPGAATSVNGLGHPQSDAERQDGLQYGPPRLEDTSGFDAGVLYAMAYFPAPSGVRVERANHIGALYGDARAGYGLYSFLLGGPVEARSSEDVAGYAELLRAIETYVLDPSGDVPRGAGRHGFLVQVDPLRTDQDLYAQVTPGLSLQIQSALARQLRLHGQVELADRLDASTGPFLVTSLRPSLLPVDELQPLLVVDLTQVGPEYMYSLVDVYDRPVPGDLVGRAESLSVLARRLQQMFPSRQVDRSAAPPPSGGWIWLIGEPGQRANAAPMAGLAQGAGRQLVLGSSERRVAPAAAPWASSAQASGTLWRCIPAAGCTDCDAAVAAVSPHFDLDAVAAQEG